MSTQKDTSEHNAFQELAGKTERRSRVRNYVSCLGVLIGGALLLVLFVDRAMVFHVYSYRASQPLTSDGIIFETRIIPGNRINDGWPERFEGPPYEVQLMLTDTTGNARSVTLRSCQVRRSDGRVVGGVRLTKGTKSLNQKYNFALLHSSFAQGDWGRRPTLEFEVELELRGKSIRRQLEIPLKPYHHREFGP